MTANSRIDASLTGTDEASGLPIDAAVTVGAARCMKSAAGSEPMMLSIHDTRLQGANGPACQLRALKWSGDAVMDACTVRANYGDLLALMSDGSLHGVNLDSGASVRLCRVDLPDLPPSSEDGHFGPARYRLHASLDGQYAAVVVDKGRNGVVVNTRSGEVSMRLDGGDYFHDTVPFSACFLRLDGQDVLVHRTAWNRLDAADPATGVCLTSRDIAPYESAGERPAHYLDYFHGQLRPSPDGSFIFDDGWVWHPVSIPRVWSVTQWLRSNPWESEDGSSIVDLVARDDWSKPACWTGDRHVALWGLAKWHEDAPEDVEHGPGVRIVDVMDLPASPEVWPMASQSDRVLDLFCDGARLYVVDDAGTTAWDLESRMELARFPGFTARLLDPTRNSLVAFSDLAIHELRLPWSGGNDGLR